MLDKASPNRVGVEQAIQYLREHPEAELCCEDRRWWITSNANNTDQQEFHIGAADAEKLSDHPALRPVFPTGHPGRRLWVVRRMI